MPTDHELLNAMVDRDADPVHVDPSFAGQVCSISMHLPNRILLLNCPGQLYTFLHSAIRCSYRPGISSEQGQQAILLNGLPFQSPGPGTNAGPQIHCAIVRCMLACGWEIATSCPGISLRVPDIHTYFFHKARVDRQRSGTPVVCAMTFLGVSILRLIDAPVHLLELIKVTLEGHWKRGEKGAVTYRIEEGVPQFMLKGRLFDAGSQTELMATRTILAQLISKMTGAGYDVITSCQSKVTNAGMRPQELDTWIIECPKGSEDATTDATPIETFRD